MAEQENDLPAVLSSTPLAALPAVSLDTETTGLDAAVARLLQIGAVRLTGTEIDRADTHESLVDPGQPIPESSTAIHGISDADVTGAPIPGAALTALAAYLGDTVVVGHTTFFDLQVLAREAETAGIDWQAPRALCVRRLAQAAIPGLADYSLDGLCAHFEVTIEGRHTALGDAIATAEVFAALVPLLRGRNIRTLAEAEAASRRIDIRDASAGNHPALGEATAGGPDDTEALARIDSYPYRHRVADVMSSPPAMMSPDSTLGEALDLLVEKGVSSVFLEDTDGTRGIVTERDVLRALHAHGADAPAQPLRGLWTTPLESVSAAAPVYRAIGRMDRLDIRHLGVLDESGALVGAVTTRNLLRHRATAAMILGDEIAAGAATADLAAAWAKVPLMAQRLADEGVDGRTTAGVISAEIRMLTRRAAELGETRMRDAGRGGPPCDYAVLVLGSGGRGESLIAADQDNAIVYAEGGQDGPQDAWFAELGGHIADILDEVGVPYCDGGVMAREPAWRRSLADWQKTIDHWVGRQTPEDLLNVDIFFDAATAGRDPTLGNAAWSYAYDRARAERTFWRALSETLREWRAPLGAFGFFRTGADQRVDLKAGGLMPIFTVARILSIRCGAKVRGTPERLRAAAADGLASDSQIEELVEAHRVIMDTMLRQQIADVGAGVSPGPRVDPKILDKGDQADLREALRQVPGAIDLSREGML